MVPIFTLHFLLLVGQKTAFPSYCCSVTNSKTEQHMYRSIAESAWQKILVELQCEETPVSNYLKYNQVPAKNAPEGTVVRIESRIARSKENVSTLIQYARLALLETSSPDGLPTAGGIQVLNMVIFPSKRTNLPVWGADFVSLPGDKHLLLLDAQPMSGDSVYHPQWAEWHREALSRMFPNPSLAAATAPSLPEAVQKYVSPCALWTRFAKPQNLDPITLIGTHLPPLVDLHLEIYVRVLHEYFAHLDKDMPKNSSPSNWQDEYLKYRLQNDPARPMLKSLFGLDWTEELLHLVLFPPLN